MLKIAKPKETLDFQLEGSETIYSIPYAKDLPLTYIDRLAALKDDATGMAGLALLQDIMERYAPGAWENLTQEGLNLIVKAWATGLGERQPRQQN